MKKFILFISFIVLFTSNQVESINPNELIEIIEAAEETELTVRSWELVGLEQINGRKMKQLQAFLQKKHYLEEVFEKDAVIIHTYEKVVQNKFNVVVKLIQNREKTDEVNLQFILTGEKWAVGDEQLFQQFLNELNGNVFTNSMDFFTCVKFVDDGIIDNSAYVTQIMQDLNVIKKTSQIDNVEKSIFAYEIYGYNESWQSKISVNNSQINIQLVVEKVKNDKRQTIIGTPVILNEY